MTAADIRLSENFVYDVLAHISVHDVVALNNYHLRRSFDLLPNVSRRDLRGGVCRVSIYAVVGLELSCTALIRVKELFRAL